MKARALAILVGLCIVVPVSVAKGDDRIYYFSNDHLGTPQALTDQAGTVVWSAEYQPFGKATLTTAAITSNLRFPGQYFDAETGLHYNWHRDYDPQTGRYLQPDPIGLEGGLNLYQYVGDNPVNMSDPTGEMAIAVAPVAAGIGLGVGFYCLMYPDRCSSVVGGLIEGIRDGRDTLTGDGQCFSKPSRESAKERATDQPSWVSSHPPKRPDENCSQFAARVLRDQYPAGDPRITRRGGNSEFSQIKKKCERSK